MVGSHWGGRWWGPTPKNLQREYVLSNSSQKPSKGIRALMEQSLLLIVVVAEYDFNTESIVMNSVRL
jgi:hypothetical protein